MTIQTPIADEGGHPLDFPAEPVTARPSGALWAPRLGLLVVADLHLGRAERMARRGGALLPPHENEETLARLDAEIRALRPETVVCAGDSFDDDAAASAVDFGRIGALAQGRRWVWLLGNHDPDPQAAPGERAAALRVGGLTLRHIARPDDATGEVSGHYHPKATVVLRGRRIVRRCFLHDRRRVILPAFGAYVGGLDATDPAFDGLLGPDAQALLLGRRVTAIPRPALARRGF